MAEAESLCSASGGERGRRACGADACAVVLRWGIQRGTAVIPKTSRVERLRENQQLFDFELNEAEMTAISDQTATDALMSSHFCEEAFGTFFPIYD